MILIVFCELIHELLSFFIAAHLILIIFQGVWIFEFSKTQTPWKVIKILNAVLNVLVNRKQIILTLICDISRCTVLGVQVFFFFFFVIINTQKWSNFAIVLIAFVLVVLVLVLNKNIENVLPVFNYQCGIVACFYLGLVTITVINKYSCRTAFKISIIFQGVWSFWELETLYPLKNDQYQMSCDKKA